MERLQTVQHRGVPILKVEYGGLLEVQESLDLIRASSARITAAPPASVRVLMSVAGAHIAHETLGAIREAALRNKPYLKGAAVVGLSGMLKSLYAAVAKMLELEMPAFDTEEEALDWLAGLP